MFKKILIANRGEIVIRIIRACTELGIKSVAVYSEADRNSLHVMLAHEAYFIGKAESLHSYLNIRKIIEVALQAKVDAIHPGYGFLSENADFAAAVEEAGIVFIGPHSKIIRSMGDKINSRKLMKSYGVPVAPGVDEVLQSEEDAKKAGNVIGYPIMLKARAGGGGKGIRAVFKEKDLAKAFKSCQTEAKNYFNDTAIFAEKLILKPKHIEVQMLADHHGNVLHLFDRECSIQRRHQKLIEEAPSPTLSHKLKESIFLKSVKAIKKMGYTNAGTLEFIYDSEKKELFFLEMNTRIQVEHPVTEFITGVDLVKEQIHIASGAKLQFSQKEVKTNGHAIELRICAEDPSTFLPSPGRIRRCRFPQGPSIRIDSYCYSGYKVPMHYDPMIAKLICWGKDREDCINKLKRALSEFSLTGIKTNILLHRNILMQPEFIDGTYDNQFIDTKLIGKKGRELKVFLDDKVFLISAAIMAYKKHQKTSTNNPESEIWKHKAKTESVRKF